MHFIKSVIFFLCGRRLRGVKEDIVALWKENGGVDNVYGNGLGKIERLVNRKENQTNGNF